MLKRSSGFFRASQMIVLHSTHWERGQFIGKFTAMITLHFHLQLQYNMNYFIKTSHSYSLMKRLAQILFYFFCTLSAVTLLLPHFLLLTNFLFLFCDHLLTHLPSQNFVWGILMPGPYQCTDLPGFFHYSLSKSLHFIHQDWYLILLSFGFYRAVLYC